MTTHAFRLHLLNTTSNYVLGKIICLRESRKHLGPCWGIVVLLAAFSGSALADFIPIPLRPDTFTHDVVIERTAPPPLVPVTTASMDTGTNNTGYSWFERGYNLDYITTGLPAAGSIYTSELNMDYSFKFAPSYKSNNAVLIDSTLPSGALVLCTPAPFARLCFLCAAGEANGTVAFTVRHQDGTSEPGTLLCPDWFHGMNPAVTAWGRVDVNLFVFNNIAYPQPGLFSKDVVLTNTTSPVTRIEFEYLSGPSHDALFAVSGAPSDGDPVGPIEVTGYNQDLVVEATATHKGPLEGASTATMDNGSANSGWTFYEQGHYPPASGTGLPPAGSMVTSASAPDHRFVMPPSYLVNNAVLLDDNSPEANLEPADAVSSSVLSLLCAAGHGPATNTCIVSHADGTAETNLIVAPDWLTGDSPALVANGRVNINNRYVDNLNAGRPCLFAVDLALTNTVSPVTNLAFSFGPTAAGAHTVLFALSGSSGGSPPPERPVLTITHAAGRSLQIRTTVPGQLQSASILLGPATLWQDEGLISSNLLVTPSAAAPLKFYRVRAQ